MATAPQAPVTEESPKISFPSRRAFETYEADFGEDTNREIETWLHEQIRTLTAAVENLNKVLVPKWRRIYLGRPRDKEKSWPWPNCANFVVQICGQEIDDLAARVMGLLYARSPVINYNYFAKTDDPHKAKKLTQILEEFMDAVSYQPEELNMYPVENNWLTDSGRLGTAFVKALPKIRTEAFISSPLSKKGGRRSFEYKDRELYSGPKVIKLNHEDFLGDPEAQSIEETNRPVCHILHLNKKELEERAYLGYYDKKQVEKIFGKPDRWGTTEERKKEARAQGIVEQETNVLAEWDIHECYFPWFKDGSTFRLIYWYHYPTKTWLRRLFNFIPDNECPIVRTKLHSTDDRMYGRGYCDMLENGQEEVSTMHNQRADATTMGITGILRVGASARNLDKNMMVYPGALVPGEKDEVEMMQMGREPGEASFKNEQMTMDMIHSRSGMEPAITGMGTGQTNKKGQYGSMGTLAVMQVSNSRINHRISDFHHSRVKLYSLLTKMYGAFGTGAKGSMFGHDDKLLEEALQDFLHKRIRVPIRAATASANKEVEKQNLLLLSQHIRMHDQATAQMLQAIFQSQAPPEAKKFFIDTVKSRVSLERQIFRDFGFDQPDEYVPEINFGDEQNGKPAPAARGQVIPMAQPQPGPSGGIPASTLENMEASRGGPGTGEAGGGGSMLPPQGR